jgi:hypothetical protein
VRAVAFVALVALAASRALGFGFVYDDSWTLTQNAALDGPLRPLLASMGNGSAPGRGLPDATRPAMVVSMWIDHSALRERSVRVSPAFAVSSMPS